MTQPTGIDQQKLEGLRRITLIGRSNSGKTNIFAALAMRTKGVTWDRYPSWVEQQKEGTDPGSYPEGSISRQYIEGEEFLDKAITAIKAGRLPQGNPPKIFRLAFEFSWPEADGRKLTIELIDYSGEWVNGKALSSRGRTEALLNYLKTSDALLIIAEAPRAGNESEVGDEIDHLKEALLEIRKQAADDRKFVIGLLVNKYDRQVPDSELLMAPSDEKLKQFFADPLHHEHDSLRASIRGENFLSQDFGLSAYGRSVVREVIIEGATVRSDFPANHREMQPFGVVAPFLWAVDQRDKADADAYVADCEQIRLFTTAKGHEWSAVRATIARGLELSTRLKNGSDGQKRVLSGVARCRALLTRRVTTPVVAVTAMIIALVLVADGLSTRARCLAAFARLDDPRAIRVQRQAALDWIDGYGRSAPYDHLLYRLAWSPAAARNEAAARRKQWVDADWKEVEGTPEDSQEKLVQEHLREYPDSPYKDLAQRILRVREDQALERKALEVLDPILAQIGQIKDKEPTVSQVNDLDVLLNNNKKLLSEAERLTRISEGLKKVRTHIHDFRLALAAAGVAQKREQIVAILVGAEELVGSSDPDGVRGGITRIEESILGQTEATADQKRKASELRQRLDEHLPLAILIDMALDAFKSGNVGQLGKVASDIKEFSPPNEKERTTFTIWKEDFGTKAVVAIIESADRYATRREWSNAVEAVDVRKGEAKRISQILDNASLVRLANSYDQHWKEMDRQVWNAFRASQSDTRIESYLRLETIHGRSPCMISEAKAWESYYARLKAKLDLIVHIDEIDSGNLYTGRQLIDWNLEEGGGKVLHKGKSDDKIDLTYSTIYPRDKIGIQATVSKNVDEEISMSLRMTLTTSVPFYDKSSNGYVTLTAKPSELSSKQWTLSNDSKFSPPVKIRFKVEGLPEAPPLPPWRDCR